MNRHLAQRGRLKRVASSMHLARPYLVESTVSTTDRHDLGVVVANNLYDLSVLEGCPGWRSLAKRLVVILFEVWQRELIGYAQTVRTVLAHADAIFVGNTAALDGLERRLPGRVHHLLPPIDTMRFAGRASVAARRIDVYNLGRRDASQHRALKRWAASTGAFYVYDTTSAASVTSLAEHRELFVELLCRSRAVVVNPARFDQPDVHLGELEVGYRFVEALTAGSLLIGDFPDTWVFHDVFGSLPGLVPFPLGSFDVPAQLGALLADDEHLEIVFRAHRAVALRRLDVAHRWAEVAAVLDIPVPEAVGERIVALNAAADDLERAIDWRSG